MKHPINRDLFRDVCRLLGINSEERRITELTLRMAVDELPVVEIVEYPTQAEGEPVPVTQKYRIEPMEVVTYSQHRAMQLLGITNPEEYFNRVNSAGELINETALPADGEAWGPHAGQPLKISIGGFEAIETDLPDGDYTSWPIGRLTGKPLAPTPELAGDIVIGGNYVAEAIAREFDFSACPDCKGTRQYQPLTGPAEPCRTCDGKAGE